MKNRIHIIFLALLLCLIPLNYGCSIIKVALKPASKGMFKKSFAKVSKYTGKYGKYVFGKGAKIFAKPSAEIKKLTGLAKDKYLKKTSNQIADAKAVRKAALSNIKNDIQLFSSKLSPKAFKRLQKDVVKNPDLLKELKRNPSAVKVYENALATKYGNNISFIRYWSNNANKFYDKGLKQFGKGEDIIFKDVNGITEITDKSGAKLGKIIDKFDGNQYVIDLTKAEKNTLANLYPMANSKYIRGNTVYLTDKYGRVVECRVTIDKNVKVFGRDKNQIARIRNAKSQYDVDGNQVSNITTNDDGGHLVADSWGGDSDFLNIVPQNSKMNIGGQWKSSEISGLQLAKKGNKVERIIQVKYPDNKSLRPSGFVLEQKVNGSNSVVDGGFGSNYLSNN